MNTFYIPAIRSDELYHYGRLGMKWGQHIFSSEKRAIRKELKKKSLLDAKENLDEQRERYSSGVRRGLFKDTIKKGSTFYRYSDTANETIDKRRKYVSLTPTDVASYRKAALRNGLSNKGNDLYLYQLISTKKMKVAKAEKVAKYIIDKYGDKSMKSLYRDMASYNLRQHRNKLSKELVDPTNKNHWMHDKLTKDHVKVNKFIHDRLYDKKLSKEVYDQYRKRGYDAVVDPEDYMSGYGYPVVILDPKSSVRHKRVDKLQKVKK